MGTMVRRRIAVSVWGVALLVAVASAPAQDAWRSSGAARVVAFGDVHGAYTNLTELLQAARVVDAELGWAAGAAHVVSLGDLLDRGPDSRRVMDLLMRLQTEAEAAGGRMHVVLGNHELMNLIGDLRYVSAEEYAAFAADETAEMREAAYGAAVAAAGESAALDRAAFDRAYPLGYFAHRAAFALDGRYGQWLAALPAIIVVNDTAFVHGGLPPLVAETPLAALNDGLQTKLRRYLELRRELAVKGVLPAVDMQRDWQLVGAALDAPEAALKPLLEEFAALAESPELGQESPLWYRGSVYCKPLLEEPILDAALAQLGVERVVVGHTPTENRRPRAIHGGKLIMLDTGMLTSYYNGRPAALVLEGGARDVQYLAPPERSALVVGEAIVAYGMTEAELVAALAEGRPSGIEPAVEDGAPASVTLSAGDASINAWFYAGDAGEHELAAAALDDLLGTALVPPTVARSIDGTEGALQLRYPDAISETERFERGLGLAGWCPMPPQLQLLYTFDLLTYNRGRSGSNVYFSNELSDLTVTAHGQAFGTERALPSGFDLATLRIPAPLRANLQALDRDTLEASLGEWLDSRQLRGLLARRDQLVADQ